MVALFTLIKSVRTAINLLYIVLYQVDLYAGVEFWTFFGLKDGKGVDLYADQLVHKYIQ